ncbi:aspartate/glutamate racemase family protein [Streptomyces sp. NPDC015346]|uniref:aspartate/glutamate racemase family protein n=1 Tax=Streptomyces sp. NPDC015346 TaxID=3364954 RepID=UPI0037015F7A
MPGRGAGRTNQGVGGTNQSLGQTNQGLGGTNQGVGGRGVVLINPNTSVSTTAMMTAVARRTLGPAVPVQGVTVERGPRMLTEPAALRAAAPEVVAAGRRALAAGDGAALIVAAFGDPGLDDLRALAGGGVPVVGIGEAALLEASAGGTPFGIATTTPLLADSIADQVARLGLTHLFTGLRLTQGAPEKLAARPESLRESLALAGERCVLRDGARAIVIAGGPLSDAAESLRPDFDVPLIAPIPAACRLVTRLTATPSGA